MKWRGRVPVDEARTPGLPRRIGGARRGPNPNLDVLLRGDGRILVPDMNTGQLTTLLREPYRAEPWGYRRITSLNQTARPPQLPQHSTNKGSMMNGMEPITKSRPKPDAHRLRNPMPTGGVDQR
jgi:hypothetical protein